MYRQFSLLSLDVDETRHRSCLYGLSTRSEQLKMKKAEVAHSRWSLFGCSPRLASLPLAGCRILLSSLRLWRLRRRCCWTDRGISETERKGEPQRNGVLEERKESTQSAHSGMSTTLQCIKCKNCIHCVS